jgi:hypothetical protein
VHSRLDPSARSTCVDSICAPRAARADGPSDRGRDRACRCAAAKHIAGAGPRAHHDAAAAHDDGVSRPGVCSQWRDVPSESTPAKRARTGGVSDAAGEGAGVAFCPTHGCAPRPSPAPSARRSSAAPRRGHHPRLLDRCLFHPCPFRISVLARVKSRVTRRVQRAANKRNRHLRKGRALYLSARVLIQLCRAGSGVA